MRLTWVAPHRNATIRLVFLLALVLGSAGVDLAEIRRRHGIDVWQEYGGRLAPLVEAGLLLWEPPTLRLSPRGLLLSNEAMSVFIDARVR